MNTCVYQITSFSYLPIKKGKSLQERREAFKEKLRKWSLTNDLEYKDYPKWLRKEFFEYWVELANDNGRRMRFEMEKTWNTGRRLATAKRTIYARDPRWKKEAAALSRVDYLAGKRKSGQMGGFPNSVYGN